MRADDPLLAPLLPQIVNPPLQPSAINIPPFAKFFDLPLQQDVPPIQISDMRADARPPLFVSLQGPDKTPHLSPTMRAYVALLSDLLLCQFVPLYQPLYESAHFP